MTSATTPPATATRPTEARPLAARRMVSLQSGAQAGAAVQGGGIRQHIQLVVVGPVAVGGDSGVPGRGCVSLVRPEEHVGEPQDGFGQGGGRGSCRTGRRIQRGGDRSEPLGERSSRPSRSWRSGRRARPMARQRLHRRCPVPVGAPRVGPGTAGPAPCGAARSSASRAGSVRGPGDGAIHPSPAPGPPLWPTPGRRRPTPRRSTVRPHRASRSCRAAAGPDGGTTRARACSSRRSLRHRRSRSMHGCLARPDQARGRSSARAGAPSDSWSFTDRQISS